MPRVCTLNIKVSCLQSLRRIFSTSSPFSFSQAVASAMAKAHWGCEPESRRKVLTGSGQSSNPICSSHIFFTAIMVIELRLRDCQTTARRLASVLPDQHSGSRCIQQLLRFGTLRQICQHFPRPALHGSPVPTPHSLQIKALLPAIIFWTSSWFFPQKNKKPSYHHLRLVGSGALQF